MTWSFRGVLVWLVVDVYPQRIYDTLPNNAHDKRLNDTPSKRSITLFTSTVQLKVEVSTYGSFFFLATYIALSVFSINTDNSRSSCG